MEKIKLVFSKNNNPGALMVRFGTWSKWSHVGLVVSQDGLDHVIDSRPFHGVKERPLSDFLNHAVSYEFKDVEVENAAAGIAWARSQIGKPYDWGGVISFATHRDWAEENCWFCSELTESAIKAAGRLRFTVDVQRISPQTCWMVV